MCVCVRMHVCLYVCLCVYTYEGEGGSDDVYVLFRACDHGESGAHWCNRRRLSECESIIQPHEHHVQVQGIGVLKGLPRTRMTAVSDSSAQTAENVSKKLTRMPCLVWVLFFGRLLLA